MTLTMLKNKGYLRNEESSMEEVLVKEPTILTDTGLFHRMGKSYFDELYNVHAYAKLDRTILEEEFTCITHLQGWYQHPNVYTVPKVVKEINDMKEILRSKIKYLNREQRRYSKNGATFRKKREEKE